MARVRFPGGRLFNFYPGTGCISFVSVLSCDVFGGGYDIVLTTNSGRPAFVYLSSVLIHNLLLLYRHLIHGLLRYKSRGVSPTIGEAKKQRKKEIR